MRLSLNISQEDKQKLLADVFYNTTPGFLNGVDLTTKEGKQKYIDAVIAGKNPFKQTENPEDIAAEKSNIIPNTTMLWADIVRQARNDSVVAIKTDAGSKNPFDSTLANTAYSKKLEEIQMDTALSVEEISGVLLEKYSSDSSARKNELSTVKFFHRLTSSIFTECDTCGGENPPQWSTCRHCGVSSDGSPLKKGKN